MHASRRSLSSTLLSRPYAITGGTALAFIALWLGAVFIDCWGSFSYALDDPYIHLALAERILNGHYGLNPGVPASPSSSILYPYLLAGFLWIGCGQFGPLIVCALSCVATVWLFFAFLDEIGVECRALPAYVLVLLTACLMLGLNLLGLVAMGLEHSLHVAVTMLCVFGLARFLRSGHAPGWFLAGLIVEPAIRYEGAAIWLAGAIVLWLCRKKREAAFVFASGVIIVIGFSLFLTSLGLPILPSSILVQSEFVEVTMSLPAMKFPYILYRNFTGNIRYAGGQQLLFILACLVGYIFASGQPWRERIKDKISAFGSLFGIVAGLGHLTCGNIMSRYTVYTLLVGISTLLLVHRAWVAAFLAKARPGQYAFFGIAWLLFFYSNVLMSSLSAKASYEMYSQQYQMHRFATEFYQGPVAVNDLGWVSYQNPYYVLDLWGLGSEEARMARATAQGNPEWMNDLAQEHNVGVAMIYHSPSWFPSVPKSWILVGALIEDSYPTVAGGNVVAFYATSSDRAAAIRDALEQLQYKIPAGSHIDIAPVVDTGAP